MVTRLTRFNFILLLPAFLVMFAGCQTPEEDKMRAVVRVHLEMNPDNSAMNKIVPIYRASPVSVNVQTSPFLTEASVEKADVMETLGGFALKIQFDHMGAHLLEQYSAMNPGKRFAIYCQFGKKLEESRWLAAPQIRGRISDGMLVFTPDCTREEADQIALGLKNVVGESKKRDLVK